MDELVICKELRFAYFACEVVRRPWPTTFALLYLARFVYPERWVIFLSVTISLLSAASPIPKAATEILN